MALLHTPAPDMGKNIPEFKLKAMDEKFYGVGDFKNSQPLLVMFICNHCPYVKAIEDRLIQLGHECKAMNVNVVGICSNDPEAYPDDNFASLKKRSQDKKYSFTYLHDPDQSVAQAFGAVCTPDFFLYDKNLKLAYRGRLDDSWKEPEKVTRRELFAAIQTLAAGKPAPAEQTPSMGCSIKWSK